MWKKSSLGLLLLLVCGNVYAAKVEVTWQDPDTNADGSALIDLDYIRVEWGSCNGAEFGVMQASINVAPGIQRTSVYPTGLSKVCVRAFAVNTSGKASAASNTGSKVLLPSLGKPATLGQPIILPF